MSNATFADLLASRDRDWCVFVQIEGIGPTNLTVQERIDSDEDARYRFCTGIPTIGLDGTHPAQLWRPYLTEVPDILSETVDEFGGVAEYGSVSAGVLDVEDLLTTILRTESFPVSTLDEDLDTTEVLIDLTTTTPISLGDTVFIGAEAFYPVSIVSGTQISAIRGYMGTVAASHDSGEAVFKFVPDLRGRLIEVYVMPLAAPWAQRRLVGSYTLDSIQFDRSLNTWFFQGRSQIQAIDGVLPAAPRSATITSVGNPEEERPIVGLSLNPNVVEGLETLQVWSGSLETLDRLFYLQINREVVSVGFAELATGVAVTLANRALVGTERQRPDVGQIAKQVLVAAKIASSFRYSPGPSPSTSRSSGAWVQTDHWVDICLCILTSSNHPDDGKELTNFDSTYGNWSCLPVGYGLGIDESEIDWESWLDARQRTDEFRFPNFVFGSKSEPFGQTMQREFLQPLGAFVTVSDGKLRVVLPANPLAASTSVNIDQNDVIVTEEGGSVLPSLDVKRDLAAAVSEIRYTVGPSEVDVGARVIRAGRDAATKIFPVSGADNEAGPVWAARAESRTSRRRQPATEIAGLIDARLWDSLVGDTINFSLPGLPELVFGTRTWSNIPCQILEREVRADRGGLGVHIFMRMKAYSPFRACFRVTPAAEISSVSVNTATVLANRYTCSDALGVPALPTDDAGAFSQTHVVGLLNASGERATTSVETISSISGNDITLSGNFGGLLAAGRILTFADIDNAPSAGQLSLYAFMGDRDTGTLGTATLVPEYFGEI